jgi:hypothetical protein
VACRAVSHGGGVCGVQIVSAIGGSAERCRRGGGVGGVSHRGVCGVQIVSAIGGSAERYRRCGRRGIGAVSGTRQQCRCGVGAAA